MIFKFTILLFLCVGFVRANDKPNIVLLMAEDIGTDLPSYGVEGLSTPNLSALAENGVQYNRFYTTSPICSTSRSALMTGMYQTSIGAHNHRDRSNILPEYVKPMTHYLREAGYALKLGSSLVYEQGRKLDLNFSKANLAPIFDKTIDEKKPLFWQIQLKMTHRAKDKRWEEIRKASRKPVATAAIKVPPYLPDLPEVRLDWAQYYDTLEYIDSEVGLIVDQLTAQSKFENTIVIFIGDNGRAQIRGKSYLWEDGIHVPLIISGKNIPVGEQVDDLISGIDLTATILRLAGVRPPSYIQGQAFLNNRDYRARAFVFAARDRHDEVVDSSRVIVSKRYKYIRNFLPEVPWDARLAYYDIPTVRPLLPLLRKLNAEGRLSSEQAIFFSPAKPEEQLYDLLEDPWELRNLAFSPEHQQTKAKMRQALHRWIDESGDRGLVQGPKGEWQAVLSSP